MFTFNEDMLAYLLRKLQFEIDKKVDKEQYIKELVKDNSGSIEVVADDTDPFDEETMIKLSDAQALLPDLVVGDIVNAVYEDKQLSEAVFTDKEKEFLNQIIANGGLGDVKFELMSVGDYEIAEGAGTLDPDIVYIVSNDANKAITIYNYATQEDLELKQDKEKFIGRVEAGGLEVVADGDVTDANTQIAVSDARIVGEGFAVGERISLEKEKVLSEANLTEEKDALLDKLLEEGFDNILFKEDVVDSLESDIADVPLSANQGKILKEEYLDNIKHEYVTVAEYAALLDVVVDVAGAKAVVENATAEGQISINDDIIVWKNKALERSGGTLIKVGDKVNITDNRVQDVTYHITDADVLYGLTEDQVDQLKVAYEHTFIDLDNLYASRKEVYEAKVSKGGKSFTSLANRLFDIDETLEFLEYSIHDLNDSVDAYGVYVNFEEQTYERILKARHMEQRDFNSVYPWAGMRRCNVKDGVVQCYEGDAGYVEDGSNGDVMVEIPKFYYKMTPTRLEASAANSAESQIVEGKWMISSKKQDIYDVHPAFIRNGQEVDHIYVGAFEACLFDASQNVFDMNDSVAVDVNADKLSSIVGAKPASGQTNALNIVNARQLAINKGTGYGLIDFTAISAIQLCTSKLAYSINNKSCMAESIVKSIT